MQTIRRLTGWVDLFKGANGLICNGLKVEPIDPQPGMQLVFFLNDYSFRSYKPDVLDRLGITEEEYNKLLRELEELEKQQQLPL